MIEIRPATLEDILAFSGSPPPVTIKALAVVKDGVVRCIAGITLEKDRTIAFSDMKDDGTPKKTKVRIAREIIEWMRPYRPIVIRTPDNMKSDKFLLMLGFEHIVKNQDINIYRL